MFGSDKRPRQSSFGGGARCLVAFVWLSFYAGGCERSALWQWLSVRIFLSSNGLRFAHRIAQVAPMPGHQLKKRCHGAFHSCGYRLTHAGHVTWASSRPLPVPQTVQPNILMPGYLRRLADCANTNQKRKQGSCVQSGLRAKLPRRLQDSQPLPDGRRGRPVMAFSAAERRSRRSKRPRNKRTA